MSSQVRKEITVQPNVSTHLTVREQPTTSNLVGKSKQRPLKVAYIMSRFPKITETFVLYEMQAIERQGIAVSVYPLQRERTKVMHPEAKPYVERAHFQPVISLPILWAHLFFLRQKPLVYLNTLWTLLHANWGSLRYFSGVLVLFPKIVYFAKLMAEEGIDHVHAHFASHPAAAGFVIHRLVGIPYSFTAHGSDLHRDRHMLREKVEEAAFVVPISAYNQAVIVNECNGQYSDKVIVIHCGVDTSVFQPRPQPTSHEQGKGPFAILCIGTLHEVKGQSYLIQACQHLQARGIDFRCHFIGDGPDEAMLKKQAAELGLTEQIKFHGRLTREQIVTLLHDADVVATPSVPTSDGRREGIPVVLMEAMGSGVAVIASRLSGIPELVLEETCGLLAEPRDAKGLADGLERLYREPDLRRRFGQAGRKQVVENFDLFRNAEILADYFRL